jgi:hypothetical protein
MIHLSYIFLLLFISIFGELFFGSYYIIMPFAAVIIFYLTMIYNLKIGIILAIIVGSLLDILYGHTHYISPITLSLVALFSIFWLHKGIVKHIHLQILPGGTISFIYAFPLLAINYFLNENGFLMFLINILILLLTIIFGAVLLPITILLLDSINAKLKINLYTCSKNRLAESR